MTGPRRPVELTKIDGRSPDITSTALCRSSEAAGLQYDQSVQERLLRDHDASDC